MFSLEGKSLVEGMRLLRGDVGTKVRLQIDAPNAGRLVASDQTMIAAGTSAGWRLINQVVFGSSYPDCSPQRPYARRSALATFVSAISSVLCDVAMFIRIWPSPPNPYDVPALI